MKKKRSTIKIILIVILLLFPTVLILSFCGRVLKNDKNDISNPFSYVDDKDSVTDFSYNSSLNDNSNEQLSISNCSYHLSDKELNIKIDNVEVEVYWLDNSSIDDLKELSIDGLTLNCSSNENDKYQAAKLDKKISSFDTLDTYKANDIILYNKDEIRILYDSSYGLYTKLGHINISKIELVEMLTEIDVTITFTLKDKTQI